MALPLASIRVVELGSLIAGPFAGRLLADFGAVVRVAHWLETQLGRPLPGALSRPGCTTRHEVAP